MKYKLSDINLSQEGKVSVPDILHFVWIGDTNQAYMNYIDIWEKTNPDKTIYFWCDIHTSTCHSFHKSIQDYIDNNHFEDKHTVENSIKNEAFNYIFPKINQGKNFDDSVENFLSENGIPFLRTMHSINPKVKNRRIVIKSICNLFDDVFSDFIKYYYYEIILRGNLASASDIVRLIIIYKHGGTYIDMDTLPHTDNIFENFNHFCKVNNFIEDDFLIMFKTKKILNKLSLINISDRDYLEKYTSDGDFHRKIVETINADIIDFSLRKILPLGEIYVHKNLLSIGAVRRFKGIYFNNFISSHAGSKTVRIILRVMKKRYRFLEKNDCVFNFCKKNINDSYLSRVLSWRTELIKKNYCVTSILTGPGLIVEVLLGLAYELIDLDSFANPSSVAEYMHNEKFGIALFQHNLDTPEGVHSSWKT